MRIIWYKIQLELLTCLRELASSIQWIWQTLKQANGIFAFTVRSPYCYTFNIYAKPMSYAIRERREKVFAKYIRLIGYLKCNPRALQSICCKMYIDFRWNRRLVFKFKKILFFSSLSLPFLMFIFTLGSLHALLILTVLRECLVCPTSISAMRYSNYHMNN